MQDKEVNRFRRAAGQRLTSAEILYKSRMYLDCMYIAGYSTECVLKALILARVPPSKRTRFVREHFRGAVAHDFEYLKGLLRNLGVALPTREARMLRAIASWTTDLRYEVGLRKASEAQSFLDAVRTIRDWAERTL